MDPNEEQVTETELAVLKTNLEVVETENKQLRGEISRLNFLLGNRFDMYTELQTRYQETDKYLYQSRVKVAEQYNEIQSYFQAMKALEAVKADLTDQVSEYQRKYSLQNEKLKSAEEEVQKLTQQLKREQSQWQHDYSLHFKEISNCKKQLGEQQAMIEEINTKQKTFRESNAMRQHEQDSFQELRNSSKLLEADKQLNLEALTDCRTRLNAEVELAANYKKYIDELQSNSTKLQQSNIQLQSNVQMLEEALSLKSMDIDMICTAMDKLKERMESALSSLQQKGDHKVKPVNSSFPEESSLRTQIPSEEKAQPLMSQSSSTSFAQQTGSVLLSSTEYQNVTNPYRVHNAEKTRQEQSNKQIGARQPRPVAEAENRMSPRSQSFHMTSQNSRMLTDSNKPLLFSSASFKLDVRSCLEGDSMPAKVHLVNRLFSLILGTIDKAQKASEVTVNDLKDDISLLEDKLKIQRFQFKDRETELVQKSAQLVSVKSELQERNILFRENTRSLMTLQDQQHKVTVLEKEKADLHRTVRAQKEEIVMLSEQIHEALNRIDNVRVGQKPECDYMREIFDLKRRNQNLIMQLSDVNDKNTDVKESTTQRMIILERKCRKAETELNKFDKLVEQIRETCTISQAQSNNPVILQVVRLIDEV